jgi:hypothetical protein
VVRFEDRDDHVLETHFERVDFRRLERKVDELRERLAAKGWAGVRANSVADLGRSLILRSRSALCAKPAILPADARNARQTLALHRCA